MVNGWVPGVPEGIELSPAWKRLVGYLLDAVIAAFTLGIGWLVWSIVVWGRGQSPGKQLIGMTVIAEGTRRPAGRGRMFFREFIAKTLIGAVPSLIVLAAPKGRAGAVLVYLLVALALWIGTTFWLLWDRYRQQLWDKLASTLVVDDALSQLGRGAPRRRSAYERAAAPPRLQDAPLPPLSAVSFERAIDYFRIGKHEVGLSLLQQAALDASRRGDERTIAHVLKVTDAAQKMISPDLRYKLEEVVRTANAPRGRTAR